MAYDDHVEETVRRSEEEATARRVGASTLTATIKVVQVDARPPNDNFAVAISCQDREWTETLGSKPDLDLFLKGMLAGATLLGGRLEVDMPDTISLPF